MNGISFHRWLPAFLIGAGVVTAGLLLIPSRTLDGRFPWYRAQSGDAGRYLLMVDGFSQPYPWGGRWLVPQIASLLPWDSVVALWLANVAFIGVFAVLVSAAALAFTSRITPVALAWAFAGGGVGLMLLFQNPYLIDAAALASIAVIGCLHLRGTTVSAWWLGLFIPVSCTVRESCAVFLLLLAVDRRWGILAVSTLISGAAVLYGFQLADAGGSIPPTGGVGMLFKAYSGLGALWILMLATVWFPGGSSRPIAERRFMTYGVACAGLALIGIGTATDTTRMVAFLLPVGVPLAAVLLTGLTTRRAIGLSLATVPAMLFVVPTRLTWARVPPGMEELEDWYMTNWMVILPTLALAAAAALVAVVLARPQRFKHPQVQDLQKAD
ncbi:MAG: hypothetical protein IPG68_04300 [Micrococcales bacterium]|nr:hypothetical protein [Micrococcales bacterium]